MSDLSESLRVVNYFSYSRALYQVRLNTDRSGKSEQWKLRGLGEHGERTGEEIGPVALSYNQLSELEIRAREINDLGRVAKMKVDSI